MGNDYNFAGLNAGEGTIRSCINDPHGECDLLVRVHEARPSTPTVLVSRSDDYASLARFAERAGVVRPATLVVTHPWGRYHFERPRADAIDQELGFALRLIEPVLFRPDAPATDRPTLPVVALGPEPMPTSRIVIGYRERAGSSGEAVVVDRAVRAVIEGRDDVEWRPGHDGACDVYVDHLDATFGGYSPAAIEAMGQGAVCLGAAVRVGAHVEAHWPRPPVVIVEDADALVGRLRALLDDRDALQAARLAAWRWARDVASEEPSARRLGAWLDEAVVRAAERDAIEPEPLWGPCERPQVACAVIARARDALELASLRAALRSVAPITDECVVILDDSSAPDSDRMLEALGVRVVRRAWTRDFAAARNAVHEHTEARWLLWIDSDEVLVDAGDLRDAIARAERGGHQGVLGLLDTVGDGGPGESLRHIRVYERTCCRWKYAVHNELEGPRSVVPSTAVFHGSYVGTAEEKVARSLPMLLEQVASQPDEPRWASLLAQTYHVMGDTGEMVRWAERCIAAAPDQRAFIHRWCDLALARFTESPGQGLSTILEAVRRHPTHPDAWHALATMALARWYETAGPVESDLSPVRTARHREQLPAAARLLGLPLSYRVREPADEGDPPPAVDQRPLAPRNPTEVEAARSRSDGLRVAFVCGPDTKFITGIEDAVAERHEVRRLHFNERAALRDVDAAMEWADVVWFEWCDELLVEASRRLNKRAHVLCRLHSYEAFTDAPARVDWRFVDRLVFVADHLRRLFEDRFEARPASVVIPNAVATDGLRLSTTGDPFAIAYLGSLDFKKGPQLLLQCLAELIHRDPRYHLHVGGASGDPRYELYFDKMIPALGLQGHVTLHGWVDDVDAWLDDKSFIVSTSVLESFGVGIAEAMAKGLTPVIHDWVGAEEIWPREHTFRTVAEFADLVLRGRGEPAALRAWVRERYDLPRVVDQVDALLREVALHGPAESIPIRQP